MSLLDTILNNASSSNPIVSQNHDARSINWVRGMSDPGEMISCGYLPQLRRLPGEADADYAARINPLVESLPAHERNRIKAAGIKAATRRASLDMSNGRVNAVFAGKPAWHDLGVVVRDAMDSYTALTMSGMDFEVEKLENSYTWGGRTIINPDSFSIVRTDTGVQLGSVGRMYKPFQNRECFALLDSVAEDFGARYETAGSIYGGRSVWMLMKLPAHRFCVTAGDCSDTYALLTNCHDGSGALYVMPTTVRVECANTFRIAQKGRSEKALAIRHTGDLKSKISKAKEALGIAIKSIDDYADKAAAMVAVKTEPKQFINGVLDEVLAVTEAQAMSGAELLSAALDADAAEKEAAYKEFSAAIKKRETILEDILARYDAGRCNPQGSVWAAFNAVTEHADHAKIGPQSRDAHTRASRRFESILTGDADTLKQAAYTAATALLV